jgi:ferredoxin, 2Fe-2S
LAGRIRVLPADVEFDVADDETVLGAAVRHGIRWPTVCQGNAECGVCYMFVEVGDDRLSAKSSAEAGRLGLGVYADDPRARLACQTCLHGDVTVTRRGVRHRTG